MEELLRLVEAHRIKGSCQRKNIADPSAERVEYTTKGGYKAVFLRTPRGVAKGLEVKGLSFRFSAAFRGEYEFHYPELHNPTRRLGMLLSGH